ncbi:MAG: HD domain-containing protein [Candidatus Paceibacterota bacterium]
MKVELTVPQQIVNIAKTLQDKGFSAYLVGGCVRDLLMNREPHDWDLTTNAKPEEIVALFPKTVYENSFGTVTVINETEENLAFRNVEITPFRKEGGYSDFRHPDEVTFSDRLEDDLKRRDFTINSLAYDPLKNALTDIFEGLKDIKDGVVRAVGEPDERFTEDALRIIRAVRFSAQLGFTIEPATLSSAKKNVNLLKNVSRERIRDEFTKLLMSANPADGLVSCEKIGLLPFIIPELAESIGIEQNRSHIYTVWEHLIRSVQHAADRDWPLHVRLSALLHDIGKPKSRRFSPEIKDNTFYGHEVIGERMTKKILADLKYPNQTIETVVKLVRNHMFFSDPDQISMSAVRRIIANVGEDLVWDLMKLRACDRIGMGRPKEDPYRLRQYEAMIEEAMRAPTSVKMLKINGNDLMKQLSEAPGPKIGFILNALLEEVLENPELNTAEYLTKRSRELIVLPLEEIKALADKGKEKKDEVEAEELKKIRKKHKVN